MTAIVFPSSPSVGTQFISPIGQEYVYDGVGWTTSPSSNQVGSTNLGNSFRYRSIYTRGYTSCGYQNSSPWNNCNRTVHATDTTTNLGTLYNYTSSYICGGYSDFNHYVYGNGSNAVGGQSTITGTMSMITETGRGNSSSWNTQYSRGDCGVLMNAGLTCAYISGSGTSATDRHVFATDTISTAQAVMNNTQSGGAVTGFYGQYYGYLVSNGSTQFNFTTEIWVGASLSTSGCDGHSKSLSSKYGYGYVKTGTYASTSNMQVLNDTTQAYITATNSPDTSGEENYQIGQDWGYCIGNYNGAQNNNAYKVTYATHAVVAGGSNMQPSGHGGMSSGTCGTASARICGSIAGG